MNKKNILHVKTPADYARWLGVEAPHPLVCVVNYNDVSPIRMSLNRYEVYGIFLNGNNSNHKIEYGVGEYITDTDTLICVSPGQIGGVEYDGNRVHYDGWALLFHPEILQGTNLVNHIKKFSFFDYSVNEALHITPEEKEILVNCFRLLANELAAPQDQLQNQIIVGFINIILRYAQRFYNRQFAESSVTNKSILAKLENLLNKYFETEQQRKLGLPTVRYCADHLALSPNYLSDLLKRATGETASTYIKRHAINTAKNLLAAGMNSSEVAFSLGMNHPQHFSRMFKSLTGSTPTEYIRQLRH